MNTGKKKGLGRGLSALFGDQTAKEKIKETKTLNTVSLSDLTRNPYQPRLKFDEAKLDELSKSIKKKGIIQPIAVRPKKNEEGKYEITKGKLIKMKKIYQTLLAETKAPLKTTPKAQTPSGGGGRYNKTRKYKNLPRVSSLKNINRNTNLNYTL